MYPQPGMYGYSPVAGYGMPLLPQQQQQQQGMTMPMGGYHPSMGMPGMGMMPGMPMNMNMGMMMPMHGMSASPYAQQQQQQAVPRNVPQQPLLNANGIPSMARPGLPTNVPPPLPPASSSLSQSNTNIVTPSVASSSPSESVSPSPSPSPPPNNDTSSGSGSGDSESLLSTFLDDSKHLERKLEIARIHQAFKFNPMDIMGLPLDATTSDVCSMHRITILSSLYCHNYFTNYYYPRSVD
jgi:hypothetical protein